METLQDLVAAGREREGVLFTTPERRTPFSYRDFCTNAWKAGNLMRHYGVRAGTRVAVVAGPKNPEGDAEPGVLTDSPDAVLALLAATLDGAIVDLDPPGAIDATALVAPANWLDRFELAPGTKALAYGGPSDDPTVAQFERELWSENPLQPPGEIGPGDPALAGDRTYTHGDLVAASQRVAEEWAIDSGTTLALRAPVTSVGAVVAGILAPMAVGATVTLGDDDPADVAVAVDGAPEERVISPADVLV